MSMINSQHDWNSKAVSLVAKYFQAQKGISHVVDVKEGLLTVRMVGDDVNCEYVTGRLNHELVHAGIPVDVRSVNQYRNDDFNKVYVSLGQRFSMSFDEVVVALNWAGH